MTKFLTNKNFIKSSKNMQEFLNNIKQSNNNYNKKIIIAIDFWLYAHKFLHSCHIDNIIIGFWNQIIMFLSYGIIPLYVLDGRVPIEKKQYNDAKIKKKIKYKKEIDELDADIEKYININDIINSELIDDMCYKRDKLQKYIKRVKSSELYNLYNLFDLLGVPYIRANYEADALCAKLYKEHIITACLSDDMDMLALGCGTTIKIENGIIIEFDLKHVINELQFTQDQFIDMCIMFGCDYLHHPFHLDCNEVYEMIKKHGSLLDFLSSNEHEIFNMNNSHVKMIGENYYHVKEIYLNSHFKEDIPTEFYDLKMKKILIDDIFIFLKKIKMFKQFSKKKQNIKYDLELINILIDNNEL